MKLMLNSALRGIATALLFNQLFTMADLYIATKPIFYEENFKLFFVHPRNPHFDKMQEAGNR